MQQHSRLASERRLRTALVILAMLLCLGGYALCYKCCASPEDWRTITARGHSWGWYNTACYAFPKAMPKSWHGPLEVLFEPAHQLDLLIRPDYWKSSTEAARRARYQDARDRAGSVMYRLRLMRPPAVDPRTWQKGLDWSRIAFNNICITEDYASFGSVRTFEQQLSEKLKSSPDLTIFDWIWDRLGETGPHGENYVKLFRAQMHSAMAPASP